MRPFDLAFYECPFEAIKRKTLLFILKTNYIVINVRRTYFSEVRIIMKIQYEEHVLFVIPRFGEQFLILLY